MTGIYFASFNYYLQSYAHGNENFQAPLSSYTDLLNYGALGFLCFFLIIALGYFVKSHRTDMKELHKCHAAERKEWKDTSEKQHEEFIEVAKKVVEVISEVKGAINTKRSNL